MGIINKKIHYCWFGNKPKSELMLNCIKSWKKKLPDFELIEWNNSNISEIKSPYFQAAIKNRKWAFAADYGRLWALYNYGGIYFDTDIEVLKSFDDLLENNSFIGVEKYTKKASIACGIIGTVAKNPIFKDLMQIYDTEPFFKSNGRFKSTPNPTIFTKYFWDTYKFKIKNADEINILGDNLLKIYPPKYFYPKRNFSCAYTIHHYAASWQENWSVRTWLNTKHFTLHLLKRETDGNPQLPLLSNEELIGYIKLSGKKYFALVRKLKIFKEENYEENGVKISLIMLADDNYEQFNEKCNSVLAQYYQNFEILVGDMSSNDRIKRFLGFVPMSKIKYFRIVEKSKEETIEKLKGMVIAPKVIIIDKRLTDRKYLEQIIYD